MTHFALSRLGITGVALLALALGACAPAVPASPTLAPPPTATPVTPITRERAIELATADCRLPDLVLVGAPSNIQAQLVTRPGQPAGGLMWRVQMDGLLQLVGGPSATAGPGPMAAPPTPYAGICTVLLDATTGQISEVTDSPNPNAPRTTPRPAATLGNYPAAPSTLATRSPTASPRSYPMAAPTPTPPPAFTGFTAQVELDIFSGRPNPTWPLADAQIETLRQKLAALSPAAAEPYPDRLGYRGLSVTLTDRSGAALPLTWRVWGGVAQMTNGGTTIYFADPDHALERWLLQTGQPYLPPDLLATVQADLSGTPAP